MNLNGLKIASNLNINESTWYFQNIIGRFSMVSKNNCFAHFKTNCHKEMNRFSPYEKNQMLLHGNKVHIQGSLQTVVRTSKVYKIQRDSRNRI